MLRTALAALGGAALAATAFAAVPALATSQPQPHLKSHCAHLVLAQQTQTGHEADLPIILCGKLIRHHYAGACYVRPWGPLVANVRLHCS